MFSKRTGWDLTPNALSEKKRQLETGGAAWLDLTESNPTRAGILCPEEVLRPLADSGSARYEPDPRGLFSAREAVARLFSDKGAVVPPDHILLTASTSEAYSHLFRLLADPEEPVLVPRPSYPLFQYLAELSGVQPVSYPLRLSSQGWRIDWEALEASAGGAKAVVVVHPNNPTGSALRREDFRRLLDLCRRRQMALISDEVFAEYLFSAEPDIPATLAGERGILLFALGGLSKWMGLPQMKLAWTAVSGPEELLKPALSRLEFIADNYLSVNTPAQRALPKWLAAAGPLQAQIRGRIKANLRALTEQCRPTEWRLLPADGGWSAVLKNGALRDWEEEERWVVSLLEKEKVLVYPGCFFDFDEPGHLILSLLAKPDVFSEGVNRLLRVPL